jgi:hypothetical protein
MRGMRLYRENVQTQMLVLAQQASDMGQTASRAATDAVNQKK